MQSSWNSAGTGGRAGHGTQYTGCCFSPSAISGRFSRIATEEAGGDAELNPRRLDRREAGMKLFLLLVAAIGVLSVALLQVTADDTSVTTEVQVAVRELSDGRLEFAVVHDGEFHYPRARRIRPNLGHSRWLRSSPVMIDAALPPIGDESLDRAFSQLEASCGRQLRYFEDWRPPDALYSAGRAEDERERARQHRDACERQLNAALQVLAFASVQGAMDPQTAEQYSISIDTTRLISQWTYIRMMDLIAQHSLQM